MSSCFPSFVSHFFGAKIHIGYLPKKPDKIQTSRNRSTDFRSPPDLNPMQFRGDGNVEVFKSVLESAQFLRAYTTLECVHRSQQRRSYFQRLLSRPCGPILKIVKDILPIFPFSPFFSRGPFLSSRSHMKIIDQRGKKQNVLGAHELGLT